MPVVIYKEKKYVLRWKKEWDKTVARVGEKYKRGSGSVAWKRAIDKGEFRDFPDSMVTGYVLSKRLTLLRMRQSPRFKKVRLDYYRKHADEINIKRKEKGWNNRSRKVVFDVAPQELKKEHGHRPRQLWSEKQLEILMDLVGKYRKGPKTTDWKSLLKDPKSKIFPYSDISVLRKYYGSLIRKKKHVQRKREQALKYKHSNYTKYLENQNRRRVIIQEVANDFLMEKLK